MPLTVWQVQRKTRRCLQQKLCFILQTFLTDRSRVSLQSRTLLDHTGLSTLLAELTKFSGAWWASSRRNKNSELSYDAEFRLVSDASKSLTSPTKNSSLFGIHRAAMTKITSEMRKAQVPSLPSVDSYLVVTRFLCIFTSASFRTEILVFGIRICDVRLSSN